MLSAMAGSAEKLVTLDRLLSALEKAGRLGALAVTLAPGLLAYLLALWERTPQSIAFVLAVFGFATGLWLYNGLSDLHRSRSAAISRADFESWDKVNELTFAQIANLWAEHRAFSSFDEAAYANFRMLKEQANAGTLIANKNGPHYFNESTATRENLIAFALARGERPKFLFKDTR